MTVFLPLKVHKFLYTFSMVLMRRVCLTIKTLAYHRANNKALNIRPLCKQTNPAISLDRDNTILSPLIARLTALHKTNGLLRR